MGRFCRILGLSTAAIAVVFVLAVPGGKLPHYAGPCGQSLCLCGPALHSIHDKPAFCCEFDNRVWTFSETNISGFLPSLSVESVFSSIDLPQQIAIPAMELEHLLLSARHRASVCQSVDFEIATPPPRQS